MTIMGKAKNTSIDMFLLSRGYKKYIDIYSLYKDYNKYLELPDTDPDDEDNDYYKPDNEAQRVWYLAQKFHECAGTKAISTEEVEVCDTKYTLEKINNVIIRVNNIYYYNYVALTNWIRGENTDEALEKYFD